MAEVFGPYRLEQLLGRGGMGEVWLAHDTRRAGRTVAVKRLLAHRADDADFRAHFQRECAIVARLRGPHILPVYAYGDIDGRLYLEMGLVRGCGLDAIIKEGPLAPDRAVEIVSQVARALDAAHAAGVVHRDVKPANVLVTGPVGDECAFLIDFGIARGADTTTHLAQRPGSLHYMAPERLGDQPSDRRADIYSLACTLFSALTGKLPAPAILGGNSTGLSHEIDDVLARGMATAPDDRFPSAGALAAAARGALALPVTEHEPALPPPRLEWDSASAAHPETAHPGMSYRSLRDAPPSAADPSLTGVSAPVTHIPPRRDRDRAEMDSSGSASRRAASSIERAPLHPEPISARQRRRTWATAGLGTTVVAAAAAIIVMLSSGLVATPDTIPIAEHILTGHRDTVSTVAVAQLDEHPVILSGSTDRTVRVWDPVTGAQIGDPLTGHTDNVRSVAAVQLDGRPVIVSGSSDKTIRMWDLATHAPVGDPLTGHSGAVDSVAVAQLDGRPVVVSGDQEGTVRVWDPGTGLQVGDPLTGHSGAVSVAVDHLDGRPVIVTGSIDQTIRVWDLTTHAAIGAPITGHTQGVHTVAIDQLDGRPVIVSGSFDRTIRVWDLATQVPIGDAHAEHSMSVLSIVTGRLDGHPVIISASQDQTVRVWDLATRVPIGDPLIGHTSTVRSVAIAQLDGRTAIISGSYDNTIRVWDLAQRVDL